MSLLIRNGTIVTATERWHGDVRCNDGEIAEIGVGLEPAGEELVDATGRYVFPGGVDPHVHMELPVAGTVSSDDFESGSAAAIAGGTTTIVDFVHPERGQAYADALRARLVEGEASVCDYGLHMAVTWWGDGCRDGIRESVAAGIPTFKVYLAYKDVVGIDDADLIRAMAEVGKLGAMVIAHCEHGEIVEHLRERYAAAGHTEPRYHAQSRPPEVEGEATARAAMLAALTDATLYVVHVTCRESLAAIRASRALGRPIFGETCPHYLLLDESVYDRPDFEGAAYVCAPPIRPREHQEELWQALIDGALQVVATDHCPFNMAGQRELGRHDFRRIPGGTPGIEHRLALLYTHGVGAGRFELERFVDLVSTGPAKLFGLYPRKGAIAVGSDADLVLWDPEATGVISAASHHHRCDRSIYEGFEVRGLPSTVISGGRIAYRDGALTVTRGAGRFLKRGLPQLEG